MDSSKAQFYGTRWCPDSRRAKLIFEKLEFPFEYLDVDSDKDAREKVKLINHGNCSVPTIIFPDSTILTEPDSTTLETKILSLKNNS